MSRPRTLSATTSSASARSAKAGAKAKAKAVARTPPVTEPSPLAAGDEPALSHGAADPEQPGRRWQGFADKLKSAQVTSKQTATASSWLSPFGLEIAVKVNHVDPLSAGRDELKLQWIAGGDGTGADIENTIHRTRLRGGQRLDLQGPALSARPDGGTGLPLRARLVGVAWSKQIQAASPGDDSPPRAELKIEVKLTDRGVAQLAALAGATAELSSVGSAISGSGVADVVGRVLMGAVPIVGGVIALCSVRRAVKVVRDASATKGEQTLAVLRACADALLIVNPAVSAAMNIGLVLFTAGKAVVQARRAKRAAKQAAGP